MPTIFVFGFIAMTMSLAQATSEDPLADPVVEQGQVRGESR